MLSLFCGISTSRQMSSEIVREAGEGIAKRLTIDMALRQLPQNAIRKLPRVHESTSTERRQRRVSQPRTREVTDEFTGDSFGDGKIETIFIAVDEFRESRLQRRTPSLRIVHRISNDQRKRGGREDLQDDQNNKKASSDRTPPP